MPRFLTSSAFLMIILVSTALPSFGDPVDDHIVVLAQQLLNNSATVSNTACHDLQTINSVYGLEKIRPALPALISVMANNPQSGYYGCAASLRNAFGFNASTLPIYLSLFDKGGDNTAAAYTLMFIQLNSATNGITDANYTSFVDSIMDHILSSGNNCDAFRLLNLLPSYLTPRLTIYSDVKVREAFKSYLSLPANCEWNPIPSSLDKLTKAPISHDPDARGASSCFGADGPLRALQNNLDVSLVTAFKTTALRGSKECAREIYLPALAMFVSCNTIAASQQQEVTDLVIQGVILAATLPGKLIYDVGDVNTLSACYTPTKAITDAFVQSHPYPVSGPLKPLPNCKCQHFQ